MLAVFQADELLSLSYFSEFSESSISPLSTFSESFEPVNRDSMKLSPAARPAQAEPTQLSSNSGSTSLAIEDP